MSRNAITIKRLRDNETLVDRLVAGKVPQWPLLRIPSGRSELEFLHGCEAWRELLYQAGKILGGDCEGQTLLRLWIELGRPHPAILRRFWCRVGPWQTFPSMIRDSKWDRLIELVDWSCAAYEAIAAKKSSSEAEPSITIGE
jgi:hypothetical protein